jgi:hypothetical protein
MPEEFEVTVFKKNIMGDFWWVIFTKYSMHIIEHA